MKATIIKKPLVEILARCQGVANKKSTMPVLANVLIEDEDDGTIRVSATDLYSAVSGTVSGKVETPGKIAVPARDLLERVKMMPDGENVILETDKHAGSLSLKAEGTKRRYTMHGIPGEDFPPLPKPGDDAEVVPLDANALGQLIAAVHFSISNDETRLHLNSALLECGAHVGERVVRMVSTDGHRLSRFELTVDDPFPDCSMLIPLKGVTELKRICDDMRGKEGASAVRMIRSEPNLFFEAHGLTFSVKLVDAQFPPYQQVIPESTTREATVPRVDMMAALRAVAVSTNEKVGGVTMTLCENAVTLKGQSPESGDGFDEVTAQYEGTEESFGLNARYALDVLGATESDEAIIQCSGPLDPIILRPKTNPDGTDYLCVIMPQRI